MSKNLITIGAVSVVSMLAGVALSLAFTAEALDVAVPGDGADAMQDVAGELRKTQIRLDRVERVLERELSATRRDVRDALDRNALAGGGAPRRAAITATASRDGGGEGPHAVREELAPMSGPNLEALGPMAGWAEDAELRKKWTFASEQKAIDTFGTPDEVAVRGSSEWWTYWDVVEGDKIASEYRLKFNNGRLVQTQRVKWEKPRPKPTASR